MSFVTHQEGKCHEGAKPSHVCYLKDGQLLTTGFSKMSERQYALWSEVCCKSSVENKTDLVTQLRHSVVKGLSKTTIAVVFKKNSYGL